MKQKKQATLGIALIPVIFLVGLLIVSLKFFGADPHIPLFISAMFAAVYAMQVLNFSWKEIEEGIVDTIKMAMGAIIILMVIGMVIGTWIQAGVVPAMIYYGLKVLSPSIFLIATLLICSIVSLATGSSWTTAGTVGIALMGVGMGLGIPAPMVGGAIISGGYFGDKMSPLSDTTNLAPAMAGADLFDHIRHMVYTTGPSYLVSIIVFGILGMRYAGGNLDQGTIDGMLTGIESLFTISPILLLLPLIVIGIVVMKTPAIPGLFSGALLGGLFGMIFQGASLGDAVGALHYGFSLSDEASAGLSELIGPDVAGALGDLLNRGGMDSMMWTISLILCAMIFGGVMEKTGMLQAIAGGILKIAKSTGSLVVATIVTAILMNMGAGDQYLAIVIPGRMFKDAYDERGLAPKNLSRVLEDSATLTSPLIPWNTCGAFMIATLGLAPWTYVPYCVLNLLNPLVSIFYGYTGITMHKVEGFEENAA